LICIKGLAAKPPRSAALFEYSEGALIRFFSIDLSDAMTIADYFAIGVLIALALWGAARLLRGRQIMMPDAGPKSGRQITLGDIGFLIEINFHIALTAYDFAKLG
jgi:hypothetical protein